MALQINTTQVLLILDPLMLANNADLTLGVSKCPQNLCTMGLRACGLVLLTDD